MNEDRKIILINKMCTGSFNIDNIGHEIINYFKDDNNENYIYVLPYGGIASKYDDKIDIIIMTSSLSNKRIEVQAIVELDDDSQIHRGGDRGSIEAHKNQLDKLKDITYGGIRLDEIFKDNKGNDKAIYITFKAKK